jgi:hypothetical protein
MEWLNLHTSILDSPAVIGSDPVDRGTWLMLLRYCIGQENGGIITACREWKDRKWQQVVRVTLSEVNNTSDLWKWNGDDLHIAHYPIEKQTEVQHLRYIGKLTTPAKAEAARANGKKSAGRPTKNPAETQRKPNTKPNAETQHEPNGNPTETQQKTHRREGKDKGMERNGREEEAETAAAAPSDINQQAQRLFDAYATARRSHLADGLREAKAAILRHGFTDVMTGTQAIVAVVQTWTPAEKLTYVKRPDEFFRGDHWADDPSHWLPRKAREEQTRATASTDPALSLGGRKPASTTLL